MADQSLVAARAAVARAHIGNQDPEYVAEVTRNYRAAKLAAHIKQVVDAMPPLTTEQRADLARMLSGGERA